MLHATIKKCSEAMPELKFNVCIAQMMSFLNVVEKEGISRTQFEIFILILAPFVPHIAEELWHNAGHKSSVHLEKWPTYNPKKLIADAVDMPVQINGKVRGSVRVAVDAQEAEIVTDAHASVQKWITGKHIIKTIVVPGRIVNIVISE
jgi:leucyl-tRNA synthetase